nr:hypothetical protein [Tanacetum cinerariifolium]
MDPNIDFSSSDQIQTLQYPEIDPPSQEIKSNLDFKEEICLIENLLYDNSSPRPPEELNAEIANIIVESFPSLPIPIQDNDSQREEIDIVTNTDDVLLLVLKTTMIKKGKLMLLIIPSPILKMSYLTMEHLILMTRHFHYLLRNHQTLSLILSPILKKRFQL